ncbi:apolipoprotein acyltransferase [Citreimonas salinaria]|uniref:PEP-CTERM protein-sorting domain-containing protein n=1 Tax=Citreimonas salinaria TaxID=321339 RepID=A0A1H3IK83_9RHOB|nr:apolipoprotein acyltransferase [Citreimonas salinaria]SDY28253.1 PEP-CTERM protein-sorting domain-containing protein [Citreimonas salinaria]
MIILLGILGGAIAGALVARRRKGNAADIAQYAVVYAIAFGLLGFIVTIVIERLL